MDDFTVKFRDLIDAYPEALADRKILKNILNDTFPTDNKEINLLLNGYDCGVVTL